MPKKAEVLVVGAGPVGMLTALLLAQQGVRTRIIDQKSQTAAYSYACALHPASLCLLERAGLVKDVIALGWRVETVGLYEGPTRRAQVKLSDLPGRYPFALALAQFLLEELLEEKLRGAGVHVEWHRRLCKIKPDADGVSASIEKVAPTEDGERLSESGMAMHRRVKVHADFVVGADGYKSLLRQQLDIGSVRAGAPQLFGVYEVETADAMDHEMKLVLDDAGMSVLWPLAENRCRWSFEIVLPEAAADFSQKGQERLITVQPPSDWDSLHHLRRFLAQRAPWFQPAIKDIHWLARAHFGRQLAVKFGQGRCWLAGDAAHQASPAGMQSMNAGLREAAELADKLKSILRDESDPASLRNYESVYRAEWEVLLGLKPGLAPPSHLSPWARQHFATILSSLPASGDDLKFLLEKLETHRSD
jgi:NADPH-dependent dioxygenase